MKSMVRAIAIVVALVSTASAASAQVGMASRFVTVGVGGGMSVPVSEAGNAFNNGFNLQGFARLNMPSLPVMPRFDLNFSKFDFNEAQTLIPGTNQILSGLANLQFSVLPLGPVKPYLIAGLGAYHMKMQSEGLSSVSQTRFGINGGAGLALNLGRLNGYVEARVDNVFTEQGMIDDDQIQVVPVTFGLTF